MLAGTSGRDGSVLFFCFEGGVFSCSPFAQGCSVGYRGCHRTTKLFCGVQEVSQNRQKTSVGYDGVTEPHRQIGYCGGPATERTKFVCRVFTEGIYPRYRSVSALQNTPLVVVVCPPFFLCVTPASVCDGFSVTMNSSTRCYGGDVWVAGLGEGGVHRVGAADVLHIRGDGDEGVDHLLRLDSATGGGGHPQRFRKVYLYM